MKAGPDASVSFVGSIRQWQASRRDRARRVAAPQPFRRLSLWGADAGAEAAYARPASTLAKSLIIAHLRFSASRQSVSAKINDRLGAIAHPNAAAAAATDFDMSGCRRPGQRRPRRVTSHVLAVRLRRCRVGVARKREANRSASRG